MERMSESGWLLSKSSDAILREQKRLEVNNKEP